MTLKRAELDESLFQKPSGHPGRKLDVYSHSLFSVLATPWSYGRSQARDQIRAAAMTYTTTVAMPDPWPTVPQWELLDAYS